MFRVSRPMLVVVLKPLGDGHERHTVRIHHLHQLREIHQRAGEPVNLVDHDDVDQVGLDVAQQALQRRPLQRAAGEPAIVVAVAHQQPPLDPPAEDGHGEHVQEGLAALDIDPHRSLAMAVGRGGGTGAGTFPDRRQTGRSAGAGRPGSKLDQWRAPSLSLRQQTDRWQNATAAGDGGRHRVVPVASRPARCAAGRSAGRGHAGRSRSRPPAMERRGRGPESATGR